MKKIILAVLLVTILSTLLIGCSSAVDEKQIQTDLQTNMEFEFLEDGEEIKHLVIEKRQTEKEQKSDTIWCTITTEDAEVSYQKNVVLTYGLYDKGGWMLDDVSVKETVRTPLKGIAEENIAASLNNEYIIINDENWEITKENIKSISIDGHDTNLEEKSDTVIASIILDEEVEQASGKIEINYKYDDGWKIDAVSEVEDFVITIKPEKALNLTEEDLTDILSGQTFKYGEQKTNYGNGISFINNNSQQEIVINKNEISNFVIENQTSSSKGTYQMLSCRCTLTKQHVDFDIQAEIQYLYDGSNGWQLENVTILPEVVSVSIEGEWTGTFVAAGSYGEVVLSITSMDESGNVTGIYSWTSSRQAGSYYVSGTIDMETFLLNMTAGEWIDKPSDAIFATKRDINAIFYVDASRLEGIGHESASIKVSQ